MSKNNFNGIIFPPNVVHTFLHTYIHTVLPYRDDLFLRYKMGPPNNAMPKVSEYDDTDAPAAKGVNNSSHNNQSKYSSNVDPLADILGLLSSRAYIHTYVHT